MRSEQKVSVKEHRKKERQHIGHIAPKAASKNQQIKSRDFKQIITLIKSLTEGRSTKEELLAALRSLKLSPNIVVDKNGLTGDMSIVRTLENSHLMRYFHAQFFTDRSAEEKLQHLSFDYNGGQEEFLELESQLRDNLKIKSSPEVTKSDYRLYQLPESYILWIKVLTQEDVDKLSNDPYKVYKKSDIGRVIRVAIEEEIH